jgi:hypothetical protein
MTPKPLSMTSQQSNAGDGPIEPTAAEGLHLLKAFMSIADPRMRAKAIAFVERLSAVKPEPYVKQ